MTQETSTLLNAKYFYKGRKTILIAFENGMFTLLKQYPSNSDSKEDELDSSEFLHQGSHITIISAQRKDEKRRNKKYCE